MKSKKSPSQAAGSKKRTAKVTVRKSTPPETVDAYIAGFPADVRKILQKIRATIRKAAPRAEEKISYQIPAYSLNGVLLYFAGFKQHIGLYPAPRGVDEFKEELSQYKGGKGTIQLPLDEPIPYGLITRIVKFRVKSNLENEKAKPKKR